MKSRREDSRSAQRFPPAEVRLKAYPGVKDRIVPVRAVIPLRPGELTHPVAAVTDARGAPFVADVSAPVCWPDGSVKWLAAELCAAVPSQDELTLLVHPRQLSRVKPRSPIDIRESAGRLAVTAGPMRVELAAHASFPLVGLWFDHNRDGAFEDIERIIERPTEAGLEVFDLHSVIYRPTDWRLSVERSGQLSAMLRAEGELRDPSGAPGFQCVVELKAYLCAPVVEACLRLAPAHCRPEIRASRVRLSMRSAVRVNAVRCDDPARQDGWLDVVLDDGETFGLHFRRQDQHAVTAPQHGRPTTISAGGFAAPWVNAGDPLCSTSLALREGYGGQATLEVERREIHAHVTFDGDSPCRELRWLIEVCPTDDPERICWGARALRHYPLTALPAADDVVAAGALSSEWRLALDDPLAGPQLRDMLARLEVTHSGPGHFPGALVAGLLLEDERLLNIGIERARRAANLGSSLGRADWAKLAQELMAALAGDERSYPVSPSSPPSLHEAKPLPAVPDGLLALAQLGEDASAEDLEAGTEVFQRVCAEGGQPELWVLCLPPYLRLARRYSVDRTTLSRELFSVEPVESPFLLTADEDRAARFVIRNRLSRVTSVDIFPLPSPGLRADPLVVSLPLTNQGRIAGAEAVNEPQAVFEVRLTLEAELPDTLLSLDADLHGVQFRAPRVSLPVRACRERAAVLGCPPEGLQRALDAVKLSYASVLHPAEFDPTGFDLIMTWGTGPGEGVGMVCSQALALGSVVLLLDVMPGTWLGQTPAMRLVVRPVEQLPLRIEDPDAPLLNSPRRIESLSAGTVNAAAVEAGRAWVPVARTAGGAVVLAEAARGQGGAIVCQICLGDDEAALYENLIERALYLAGL